MKKFTLALGVMFLMLGLAAMPVAAAEKSGAKAGGKKPTQKKAAKPAKCWQSLVRYAEAAGGESTKIYLDQWRLPYEVASKNEVEVFEEAPVCVAYEKVLNTTCELPEKLQCNWTLSEGEKRFKKLEWKPLEPKEYWGLIEDIALSGWNEKFRAGQWERLEPEYKKELEQGSMRLTVATVDINQDGQDGAEQVVQLNRRPECATSGVFGVMNPETKRMDWKRNDVLRYVNSLSEGSEILLYNGKAFMFKVEYIPPSYDVMLYEGYSYGSGNVCRFKYLKGGTKP